MIITIGGLAVFIWLGTAFIVVVDMFRKRTAIGCAGILFFPILPFIWVLKWYGGRKRLVGAILYVSAIVAFVLLGFASRLADDNLQPFFRAAEAESGLRCSLTTMSGRRFVVIGVPEADAEIEYSSVDDMVQKYRERFVESLADDYPQSLTEGTKHVIILAIPTPSGFYACYQIESPGRITKQWHDAGEDL